MSLFDNNKLSIRMQTGMGRGGGIESLEDHIKLDMHKTKRIKFPSSNGQPGDLGQKKKDPNQINKHLL